ncbi:bacteriocin fulvocin C-related protein [Streptomyces sp. TS71-3]|uniref:bacteriocin fulvocin C-related protein n=1 Tax=Streptomyces sp. TS71-3 TaxID=2733862 RepID=UPI001BB3913D|nr:bacteriocin fulvocin C-related protein [Streptomyces sp. TS71-3]
MMTSWTLAFDAGCRSCTDVVSRVRAACTTDKLTMAALTEPQIREWRQRALGENAPWAPTLIAVDGDDVRAWTGSALSVRLVRLLGVGDSVRVIRALNHADIVRHPGRRKLLKAVPLLGLGAFVVSGGLAAPAMAAPRSGPGAAAKWVRANMDRLPASYSDFGSYPMAYRRAIFNALSPTARAHLWTAHFEHYRKTHPGLSPAQAAFIDDASRLAPRLITTGGDREALRALATRAVTTFGADEAGALLATLGPRESTQASPQAGGQAALQTVPKVAPRSADGTQAAAWWCEDVGPECNTNCEAITGCNDQCWGPCVCSSSGCGDLWLMECNGLC